MKMLCVLLPHFPWRCEIHKNPDMEKCPLIVLQPKEAAGSQKLVLDHSPGLDGLQPDMPLQEALSRHGEVAIVQADILYYRTVFQKILDSLELKSPLVEGSDLGVAYIGLDGMQFIYPDDDILINSVKEAFPESFAPQMGIAEGKFPAYLAALHSSPGGYLALAEDLEDFLKDLSCDILPVSLKSKNKLHEFGLRTLGQVSVLPLGSLQSQFGPEGRRIWELSRGEDETPLYPRCTEETVEESTVLSSVTVSLEALLVAWESMLSRVMSGFISRGMGVRSLNLWTRSWKAEHWERDVSFKEPAMDVRSAMSRIKLIVETRPQPGPVEQLGMRITGLGRCCGRQKSLFSDVRARDHLLDDIHQLEFRLGSPQVFKIKEVEPWSRIPERRYALVPLSR